MKNQILLADSLLANEKVRQELINLFEMAPPSSLRKSVSEIFFAYLCNNDCEDYKQDMKNIANDFYFLLNFLEAAMQVEVELEFLNSKK